MEAKKNTYFALALLCIGAALVHAGPALGNDDPVDKGSLKIKLSKKFVGLLEEQGVKLSPTSFSVSSGSMNPVSGTGTLALKGRLRFRTEARKLVFRKLTARLGDEGVLKVGGVRMFRLEGGKVARNGFGAQVKNVEATLTSKGARKLKRRLRLSGLSSMRAGTVAVSEQPQTVEVTGGNVRLVPNRTLTPGAGTLASKLQSHCVDFFNGNSALTPAEKKGTTTEPFYTFTVAGGTIGPDAGAGRVELSGGLQVQNTNGSFGSCNSSSPPLAILRQTELTYKFDTKTIASRVVVTAVSGAVRGAGDRGVANGSDISLSSATVSADPEAKSVTVKGIVIRQNKGAALLLNQVFPQRAGNVNGAQEFDAGDLFGVADVTVTTR